MCLPKIKGEVKIKYGIEISDNFKRAVELDIVNNNTLWKTAVRDEIAALIFYK